MNMATTSTTVHFSTTATATSSFYSSILAPKLAPPSSTRPNKFRTCTTTNTTTVRYGVNPEKWRESRRLVSISLLLIPYYCLSMPKSSMAGGLDNYVKRKKLDPLEVYVPAVILTQLQIQDLEKTLDVDQPQYAACRSLLRSGPASSLRVNIRAVAQYASESGNGTAFDNVDQCLRALEDLDSLFLRASRNDSGASVPTMKTKISLVVNALDSLLQTVPSGILNKGKEIADAYRLPETIQPDVSDPELKRLEAIL